MWQYFAFVALVYTLGVLRMRAAPSYLQQRVAASYGRFVFVLLVLTPIVWALIQFKPE